MLNEIVVKNILKYQKIVKLFFLLILLEEVLRISDLLSRFQDARLLILFFSTKINLIKYLVYLHETIHIPESVFKFIFIRKIYNFLKLKYPYKNFEVVLKYFDYVCKAAPLSQGCQYRII